MRKFWIMFCNFLLLSLTGTLAWAAAEKAEMLHKKVSMQNLSSINYFFVKWYNENLWVYAIIVTVLMGLLGGAIAFVTDIFLKAVGLDVSKIEHHE